LNVKIHNKIILRENIENVKVIGEVKRCDYSKILRLDDGRLAKIISPFIIMMYIRAGASLERKVMDADSIVGMDELYKPTSALYSCNSFVGYTMMENKGIDFNMIISSIPESQINERCFNEDTRELINNLSYIYNLSTLDMQGLIRNSINEKGMIDKTFLRKSCRDYYKFDNAGNLPTLIYNKQPEYLKKPKGDNSKWAKMVYTFENITPYQLLKAKYKGGEPTDRDKKLIENLLIDQKLNHENENK